MRFKALAETSNALHECALDVSAALDVLARAVAEIVGDCCSITIAGDDVHDIVAIAHKDPAAAPYMQGFLVEGPQPMSALYRRAVATRASTRIEITADKLDAHDRPALREYGARFGYSCLLLVPMIVDRRVLGVVGATRVRGSAKYTEHDESLVVDLASRAALFIEKATLYREARDAAMRAEEASRAKDEFLSIVSHELRTPLNAILGWAHMLTEAKERDAEMLERGLTVIRRNARTQATIIEDILDVARIVTGKLRLAMQPIDLSSVVRNAIDAVRPTATARLIEIESDLDPNIVVLGDGDRLQQVVWNLLANALKFTPEGGHIDVGLAREGGNAVVSVKDDGKGIAARDLPYVFDRFRQVDSSATRSHGGLGLGLSIVRHLVEAHGGSVRADSAGVGCGATFVFTLPARCPGLPQARPEEEPPPARDSASMRIPRTGDALRGLKVLVVDDEPDATDLFAIVIRSEGAAAVETACSAKEALAILDGFTPDVIVGDLGMPVEDGIDMIKKVRALPSPLAETPAIALTAYARAEDARRALDAGYHRHVAKPSTPAELIRAIQEVVAKRDD
jgi:signal transduction histidine kinase/CheY-like chemotaxis protein